MHETLTEDIIGYIDECNLIESNNLFKILGWCGSKTDKVTSVRLCHKVGDHFEEDENTSVASCIPRADVANFYSNNDFLNTGFEITFQKNNEVNDFVIQVLVADKWYDFLNVSDLINDSVIEKFDFDIKQDASPEFLVVDNFYDDPHAVREFALKQKFKANKKYHKGSRTEQRFLCEKTHKKFEGLLNKKIPDWYAHGVNGVFQYCTAEDAVVYHCDSQTYAGTIYLTPDAPPQCGTSFFRSKHNKLMKVTENDATRLGKSQLELDQEIFENGHYDKTNFELVDVVGNVFNRLVLWDAQIIHAASEYFGNDKTNSRLFHLFFFDA